MEARNVSKRQLERALRKVSAHYANNITWNREPEAINKARTRWAFTLRCKSCKGPGHRLGYQPHPSTGRRKRMVSACWHVHGHFFEALLSIAPGAVIRSGSRNIGGGFGVVITADGGNWQDVVVGLWCGTMQMHSELCDCDPGDAKSRPGALAV